MTCNHEWGGAVIPGPVNRIVIDQCENCGELRLPDAAPPAQAVDLGAMPHGWRLSKKATCYQLSHGNDIIGNLVGPDAEENAAIIARVLDSQAVGNG
ncbi:hypothetical protein [Stenotrophomonas forensis]